jgi:hypothetical protein
VQNTADFIRDKEMEVMQAKRVAEEQTRRLQVTRVHLQYTEYVGRRT